MAATVATVPMVSVAPPMEAQVARGEIAESVDSEVHPGRLEPVDLMEPLVFRVNLAMAEMVDLAATVVTDMSR